MECTKLQAPQADAAHGFARHSTTMPRTHEPDDDEDEGDDYDAETDYDPDDLGTYPAGLYADDERALIPCPHCKAEIDEESEQCPKCGMFITKEDSPHQAKSGVWIVLMVLTLLAMLILVLGR